VDAGDPPEGFLGRWSRRKREAHLPDEVQPPAASSLPEPPSGRQATPADAPGPGQPPSGRQATPAEAPGSDEPRTAPQGAQPEASGSGEKLLTDADMPPLETLDEGSDWSGFLSPGVSQALRKAALRRLFHLPSYNIRDGLNDYDDDFTSFATLGDTVTADMRFHRERELAEERMRAGAEDDGARGPAQQGAPHGAQDAAQVGAQPGCERDEACQGEERADEDVDPGARAVRDDALVRGDAAAGADRARPDEEGGAGDERS
jgi:hypothetical protein